MRYWADRHASGVDAIESRSAAGVDIWSRPPKSMFDIAWLSGRFADIAADLTQ